MSSMMALALFLARCRSEPGPSRCCPQDFVEGCVAGEPHGTRKVLEELCKALLADFFNIMTATHNG